MSSCLLKIVDFKPDLVFPNRVTHPPIEKPRLRTQAEHLCGQFREATPLRPGLWKFTQSSVFAPVVLAVCPSTSQSIRPFPSAPQQGSGPLPCGLMLSTGGIREWQGPERLGDLVPVLATVDRQPLPDLKV